MQKMKKNMRVVVLGCGGSGGVPYTGNVWGTCNPNNPKNKRSRPSLYIHSGDTHIVIDTTPEFRQQLNGTGFRSEVDTISAILYTHSHCDHIIGLDDLRALWFRAAKTPVQIYGTAKTLQHIQKFFDYAFQSLSPEYPAIVEGNVLSDDENLLLNDNVAIQHFPQLHGDMVTTGFRIGDFAYSTDVSHLPEESLNALKGIKIWVVGTQGKEEGSFNHAGLKTIREWVDIIKPEMTYLTHLNAFCDYDELCATLPDNIRPAYDGLEITL